MLQQSDCELWLLISEVDKFTLPAGAPTVGAEPSNTTACVWVILDFQVASAPE